MGAESIRGLTALYTRDNTEKTRSMARESIAGQMAASTKECLPMTRCTHKAS